MAFILKKKKKRCLVQNLFFVYQMRKHFIFWFGRYLALKEIYLYEIFYPFLNNLDFKSPEKDAFRKQCEKKEKMLITSIHPPPPPPPQSFLPFRRSKSLSNTV